MSICPSFALMIIFLIDSYWEINPNPKGVESMDKIKVSLDEEGFRDKPKDEAIGKISSRIGASIKEVSRINMKKFALVVGRGGYTFCPATFKDGKRSKDHFEQQQMFALDFDNKDPARSISFEGVRARAKECDLPILFAYDTFSSTNHDRFRVVFLNDVSIPYRKLAEAMQLALGEIFPEADPTCIKDVSKMYFGGKECLYYDDRIPMIDIETLFRSFHYCIKKNYGEKHYKEKIQRFSKKTGISLTTKGLLNISTSDEPDEPAHLTEVLGANCVTKDGGNSPSAIILSNRKEDGEISPFYIIKYSEEGASDTNSTSVGVGSPESHSDNHKQYRASSIERVRHCCRLFRDYEDGEKGLDHNELFGLMTSLIDIETGSGLFLSIMSKYPAFYDHLEKWRFDVQYCIQKGYGPQRCDRFCPYCEVCSHTRNILTTANPSRNLMEIDPNYDVRYYSLEEAQNDVYEVIHQAYMQSDNRIHIIKAQVGIGKSYSYLRIMSEHPDQRFLIAAPTNLLKNELDNKTKDMGIEVCVTPSLEEIKDEISPKIWKRIQWFYKRGQHRSVALYIKKLLEKEDIPCLKEYIEQKEQVRKSKGCLITTHRYMLTMDEKRLNEFDTIIVDEDIIFKSIITNQGEITISALKKLRQDTSDPSLRRKITELLAQAKVKSCIELDSFEYDIEEDADVNDGKKSAPLDIPSFCATSRFYVRKVEKERNLKADIVSFLKPSALKNMKYIIVSATADEDICHQFFGPDRDVVFHECKQAQYMGKLLQYPDKSMSRSSIDNDKGIVRRLMKHFNLDESHVITFMKEDIGFLHFGNTEGSNVLEGQDILVAGTPYHADFLYKLIAFTLGYDFDENEEMTPQIIYRNGYRVRINTYKNENLRKVHLWMMDSELDQAAGRARLLRHDCTVHLFSRFPMKQAEIVKGFNYGKE